MHSMPFNVLFLAGGDFPEVFIVRFEIRTCFEERVLKNRAHVLLVPVTSAA